MKTNIREYNEEMDVEIEEHEKNHQFVIVALNEAGFNGVSVDLIDILKFVKTNINDLWESIDRETE